MELDFVCLDPVLIVPVLTFGATQGRLNLLCTWQPLRHSYLMGVLLFQPHSLPLHQCFLLASLKPPFLTQALTVGLEAVALLPWGDGGGDLWHWSGGSTWFMGTVVLVVPSFWETLACAPEAMCLRDAHASGIGFGNCSRLKENLLCG